MTGRRPLRNEYAILAALSLVAAILFGSDVLHDFRSWGNHDGAHLNFNDVSIYRSIVEFGEVPLWNPWHLGGMPLLANPEAFFPDPWFLLDLLLGPVAAIRFKIVGELALGLAGGYWCARQFGLSRITAIYFAGTFIFSTWLALHLQAGHYTFLCGTYIPLVVGFLHRSRSELPLALVAGLWLALMAFQGGVHITILTLFLTGALALCWAVEQRSFRSIASLMLMLLSFAGLSAVKLMPTYQLVSQYPRTYTVPRHGMWSNYTKFFFGAQDRPERGSGDGRGDVLVARKPDSNAASIEPALPAAASSRALSKWDAPRLLIKIFLGREQRGLTSYFPVQSFGWHEYGAYIGPLAVLLVLCSPFLVARKAWPWMVAGGFCFLMAMGNFAPLRQGRCCTDCPSSTTRGLPAGS